MASGSFVCGHCGVTVSAQPAANYDKRSYKNFGPLKWHLLDCTACGAYSLVAADDSHELFFPSEGHPRVSNIDKVPPLIQADYEEALESFINGQHKAATVMSRRAVQGVCRDLGADPDAKLFKQIDHLAGEGELTKRLAGLAHRVRGFGNDGAHPRDDGIDEVKKDDAERALGFLEHLLEHVYIIDATDEGD